MCVVHAKVDSQWQRLIRRFPQRQKLEYWFHIRTVLKSGWDVIWFVNPQGVPPKQPDLFLILRVIYALPHKTKTMHFSILFVILIDELTYI